MPSTSTDRLDGLTTSVAVKPPVRAVTSANITLAGLQTVGGVALAENDRVLVKNQTSSVDNGIYLASTGDWTRALDFDGARDVVKGTLVVTDGISTAFLFYRVTTANPIVIGTSELVFEAASEVQDPHPLSPAEVAGGLDENDIVDMSQPYGWLSRYVSDFTGASDMAAGVTNAIAAARATGGVGFVYHTGGNVQIGSRIALGADLVIYGDSRDDCIFTYTGSSGQSAFRDATHAADNGDLANITFRGVCITTATGGRAALEFLAGGASFYKVEHCRLDGDFDFGVIGDGIEVAHIRYNDIQPANSGSVAVWLVSGDDNITGQTARFTNNVSIQHNNLRGDYGIVDDGGSNHWLDENNFDNLSIAAVLANVTGFSFNGNQIEGTKTTGSANVLFTNVGFFSAAAKGPCYGGTIKGNFMLASTAPSGNILKFAGASMHQALVIQGNAMGGSSGVSADIDCTKLSNSWVGPNISGQGGGLQHYSGTHNDADGNVLLPPQNGFAGSFTGAEEYAFGDSRYPLGLYGGLKLNGGAKVTHILTGTATWDPGSLADAATDTTQVTVTGAALGDVVVGLSHTSGLPASVFMEGQVTATNTVTVTRYNRSGGPVDTTSGTLRAIVLRVA